MYEGSATGIRTTRWKHTGGTTYFGTMGTGVGNLYGRLVIYSFIRSADQNGLKLLVNIENSSSLFSRITLSFNATQAWELSSQSSM